jgi:hypothetical protein
MDQRLREQLTHADGHPYWLNVLIRAIRGSEHRMTGFIGMIDDVSDVVGADERHRAEEREREIEARRQVTARFDSRSLRSAWSAAGAGRDPAGAEPVDNSGRVGGSW